MRQAGQDRGLTTIEDRTWARAVRGAIWVRAGMAVVGEGLDGRVVTTGGGGMGLVPLGMAKDSLVGVGVGDGNDQDRSVRFRDGVGLRAFACALFFLCSVNRDKWL